jgi:hypothetical protein
VPNEFYQWIGLRENFTGKPTIYGKIDGFRLRFSCKNQSIETPVLVNVQLHLGQEFRILGIQRGRLLPSQHQKQPRLGDVG